MKASLLTLLLSLTLTHVLAQVPDPTTNPDPCLRAPDGGSCNDSITAYFYNTTTSTCEPFLWGGCDGAVPFTSLGDCQTAQCGVPTCEQQPDTGLCRAFFPKYFYNQTSQACQQFIWGGCRGNVPFDTMQQCNHECSNWCARNPRRGPCRMSTTRYFYNTTTMMCEEFSYGGCGGVVPFETLTECRRSCDGACMQIPDRGPCKAAFPKYFFNPDTGLCEEFVWGGCGGSVPFDRADECVELCTSFATPTPTMEE